MSIYVGMVNPLGHWLRIPFGTVLRIPLRGLSGLRVTLGLVVSEDISTAKMESQDALSYLSLNTPWSFQTIPWTY